MSEVTFRDLEAFETLKKNNEATGAELDKLKTKFKKALVSTVEPDDAGHRTLAVTEGGKTRFVKLESRKSASIDEDEFRNLMALKPGVLDDCLKLVEVVDNEAIAQAIAEGRIAEDEAKAIGKMKETLAVKVGSYDATALEASGDDQ